MIEYSTFADKPVQSNSQFEFEQVASPDVFVVTPPAVVKQMYEPMVAPLLDGSANARVRAFPDTTVVAEVITTCAGALELPLLEESTTNMNTIIRIICKHTAQLQRMQRNRKLTASRTRAMPPIIKAQYIFLFSLFSVGSNFFLESLLSASSSGTAG